tara:strand:- start:131 stop:733 length:603 start_codon:yes stop_codon:yes gene_type:complete
MTKHRLLINFPKDPFILFKNWFDNALKKELNDPNAMNLTTIHNNKPSSRIVLLKSFDKKGFVFYTNFKSKKGISIQHNPNVALNFHWKSLLRQVRIEGKAIKISSSEADEYFNSRPLKSKIGAWASAQSKELVNRKKLIKNINYYEKKYQDKDIPRPPHWSGFRVIPELIEFWQDMPFRLHDRLEYKRKKNEWKVRKLFP